MTRADAYDYALPPDRIAQEPATQRDEARALFLRRGAPGQEFGRFAELPSRLRGDECLVVNDTRVIPARIPARRATGGAVECFLLRPELEPGVWRAWLSPARRVRPGETLLARDGAPLSILARCGSYFLVAAGDLEQIARMGEVPLPPYIERSRDDARKERLDADRYQTVYARWPGAVAAPTAGLHFTGAVLDRIRDLGIPVVPITLHVGPGTFKPIRTEFVEQHRVDPEVYEVSAASRRQLAQAHRDGRRLICVGTTSLRTIESLEHLEEGPDCCAETSLTVVPGHRFRHAAGLITNFHLPRSSLLMLVCVFHGHELTHAAYRAAIGAGMRFYSYGDAMVILP